MRKKKGFTLAEVLITLSIIGVVAAMTTPSLVGGYQKAKVGPSIRKFMSTLENANEYLLADKESNTISGAVGSNGTEYLTELQKYVEGSIEDDKMNAAVPAPKDYAATALTDIELPVYSLKAGDAFAISLTTPDTTNVKGSYKGKVARIYYDLNGFNVKPNRVGRDIFVLALDNAGSIIPEGGSAYYKAYGTASSGDSGDTAGTEQAWKGTCDEDKVTDGFNCAGSIADNDWKVIYRY